MDNLSNHFDPSDNLLGDGWLIRGTVMMIDNSKAPGISDIVSSQQNIEWALGRESFKIKPAAPLKILWIRVATDYDGDLGELAEKQIRGFKLSEAQLDQVKANVIEEIIATSLKKGKARPLIYGKAFITYLRELVERYRPDLIRISAIDIFIDQTDPKWFCYEGIDPILKEFRCGLIAMRCRLKDARPIMTIKKL